jgi:uncharacterized damage-inducible protein DinB
MRNLIRDLYAHQAWADAALVHEVLAHPPAAKDETMRKTLHHIVGVQRAFLSMFLARPFDVAREMRVPDTMEEVERVFRETQVEAGEFVNQLDDAGLERIIDFSFLPGTRLPVRDLLIQVFLHSQNHRGQCLARLRELGDKPPTLDWILWLKGRPVAKWD